MTTVYKENTVMNYTDHSTVRVNEQYPLLSQVAQDFGLDLVKDFVIMRKKIVSRMGNIEIVLSPKMEIFQITPTNNPIKRPELVHEMRELVLSFDPMNPLRCAQRRIIVSDLLSMYGMTLTDDAVIRIGAFANRPKEFRGLYVIWPKGERVRIDPFYYFVGKEIIITEPTNEECFSRMNNPDGSIEKMNQLTLQLLRTRVGSEKL